MAAHKYKYTRTCQQCLMDFLAKQARTKFCSLVCRSKYSYLHQLQRAEAFCNVEHCGKSELRKGLCSKHYYQIRRYGTVGRRLSKCAQCGVDFQTERRKLYCSKKCCYAAQYTKRGHVPLSVYLIDKVTTKFICEHCGKESRRSLGGSNTKRGLKNRWCSRACMSAAFTAIRNELLSKSPPKFSKIKCSKCLDCLTPLVSRGNSGGNSGGNKARQRCARCTRAYALNNAALAGLVLHKEKARTVFCKHCEIVFCPLYGAKRTTYCSDYCAVSAFRRLPSTRAKKRTEKAIRRARERANLPFCEAFDPFDVFERDGWQCRLCGIDTPRSLRGTYQADAPELDHIIPLALGGSHTKANTQCACRSCNALKGVTIGIVSGINNMRGGLSQSQGQLF